MEAKYAYSKLLNFMEYRGIPWLRRRVDRLQQYVYTDIGLKRNGHGAPRALMLFPTNSVAFYVQNRMSEGLQSKMHNIYFQALAIIDRLVQNGYVVDCVETDHFDTRNSTAGYRLIIDEGNTLPFLPEVQGQKRIFFSTGLRWDRWNDNEVKRIYWFYHQYGLFAPSQRHLKPNFSHEVADYVLFKGVNEQMSDLNPKAIRYQLAMPVDYEPEQVNRDYTRREFAWIGGWGAIHKGLDLVIDAFERMPQFRLHLFGGIEKEGMVFSWMQEKLKACPNIRYHGYATYQSAAFQEVIRNCVAHVYPSAGENGCATVAQTAHFGLIPIMTDTANNQCHHLGLQVTGDDREAMIADIIRAAGQVHALSDSEVASRSEELVAFARRRFTRKAFIESFDQFLSEVKPA